MNRSICVCIVALFLSSFGAADLRAQGKFPTRGGVDEFPTAVSLTLALGGQTNCAVLLTGNTTLEFAATVLSNSVRRMTAEIVAMDLRGNLADGSPIRLRAGNTLIGVATVGAFTTTNQFFPAQSFFDLFAELELPGGTNAVNTQPIRLEQEVSAIPPFSRSYTNVNAVTLFATDGSTNTAVGELTAIWFQPASKGKETKLGFSIDVAGTNTLGSMEMQVCPADSQTSATVEIKLSDLSGPITPNVGCDELIGTNLFFASRINKNLRAPDWRGSHDGNWLIYSLVGNGKTNIVAYGSLQGSSGVGTHRPPSISGGSESCGACTHFEGSLRGKLVDKSVVPGGKIHATYAGQFVDGNGQPIGCCPPPALPPAGAVTLAIDGVVITPCLPVVQF